MNTASKLYRLWKLYEYAPLRIKQKREDALTNYIFHGNHKEIADIVRNWDNLYPGDYGSFKKYINSEPVIKMHLGLNEKKTMKITKEYLTELIRESLRENLTEAEALKGPSRGEAHKAKSRDDLRKVAMSSGQGMVAVMKYARQLAASSDERNKKVGEKLLDLLKKK